MPHLDGNVPKRTSYRVYISQLIRFARACTRVQDFNSRNLLLTTKLLKQGYRYHKLCYTFSKFYRRNKDLISEYSQSLMALIWEGICLPEFYGDFVYKVRKIIGLNDFDSRFENLIERFIGRGYNRAILKKTSSLILHPVTVYKFSHLF